MCEVTTWENISFLFRAGGKPVYSCALLLHQHSTNVSFVPAQPAITYSKLKIATLEQCVKYVQREQ